MKCPDCGHKDRLDTLFKTAQQDVLRIIKAKGYKKLDIVDIDGVSTPIAKTRTTSKDNKYFVTAQLMESKRGLQLAVYAGEKGKKEKAQIFIEPEVKRLAFDQKNLHPNDVFVELRATFDDGSSQEVRKNGG